jgi:hypothetical protein
MCISKLKDEQIQYVNGHDNAIVFRPNRASRSHSQGRRSSEGPGSGPSEFLQRPKGPAVRLGHEIELPALWASRQSWSAFGPGPPADLRPWLLELMDLWSGRIVRSERSVNASSSIAILRNAPLQKCQRGRIALTVSMPIRPRSRVGLQVQEKGARLL